MSELKEYKEEKEHKRSPKFKQLLKKHHFISPKIIQDKTKFFFWKELLQEYSSKNERGLCEFFENDTLITKELKKKLIKCVKDGMKKLNKGESKEEKGKIEITETDLLNEIIELYKIKKDKINKSRIQDLILMLKQKVLSDVKFVYANVETYKSFLIKNGQNENEAFMNSLKFESKLYEVVNMIKFEPDICQFLTSKSVDKYIQRETIECIERKLAKNIYKLKLKMKILIIKEIERVISKLNVIDYERKIQFKPLYFQIYDVALPGRIKKSEMIQLLDNITTFLNQVYFDYKNVKTTGKNKVIKYEIKKLNKEIINKIELISTFKYYKPFIFESRALIYKLPLNGKDKILKDLTELEEYVFNSSKYEPNIDKLDDYILFLIQYLNLDININIYYKPDADYDQKFYDNYSDRIKRIIYKSLQYHVDEELEFDVNYIDEMIHDYFEESKLKSYKKFNRVFYHVFYDIYNEFSEQYPDLFESVYSLKFDNLRNHLLLYTKQQFINKDINLILGRIINDNKRFV
jgi:hypothetical protein